MKIKVLRAEDLTQSDIDKWLGFIRANPSLHSPFFSPFFTLAVAAVRQDVQVSQIFAGSDCIGYFPFQRSASGDGEPVGAGNSDFHGVVSRSNATFDARALVRASDLLSWRYHHLVATQTFFSDSHLAIRESPVIDLSLGFGHYRQSLGCRRKQFVVDLERKERKIRRELGKLIFRPHVTDQDILSMVLGWKREQMCRACLPDYEPWEKDLLKTICHTHKPGFRGLLSVLYAGDNLVAAHMGVASEATWHYWYPAYNPQYAEYSPGLLLLFKMIQEAQALGLVRVDLGKTTYRYKRSFMSSAILVAEGMVVPFLAPQSFSR